MLIISKTKDYYDGVAGTTGIDKTIVYEREVIEIDAKDHPDIFQRYNLYPNEKLSPFTKLTYFNLKKNSENNNIYKQISPFFIGFCGKIYVGWKLFGLSDNEIISIITYDNEYIKTLIEEYSWGGGNFDDNIKYILSYNSINLFREFNVPVFVFDTDYKYVKKGIFSQINWNRHAKFFINPLLKEFKFYKIFDAFQAFQEIQMFISGVLGNKEKEIIDIDDKYKITQHGFDKWSFRKESQKKQ